MAARTLNTNTESDANRLARRDAIVAQLLKPSAPRGNLSTWIGDKVADSGRPISTVAAGARAALDNAAVEYAAARQRQAVRTANRALAAADALLDM